MNPEGDKKDQKLASSLSLSSNLGSFSNFELMKDLNTSALDIKQDIFTKRTQKRELEELANGNTAENQPWDKKIDKKQDELRAVRGGEWLLGVLADVSIGLFLLFVALEMTPPAWWNNTPASVRKVGVLSCSWLACLAVPLTHGLAGALRHRQRGWAFFQPLKGGLRFVLLQIFSWSFFALSLILPAVPWVLGSLYPAITLKGITLCSGATFALSQSTMVASLLAFQSPPTATSSPPTATSSPPPQDSADPVSKSEGRESTARGLEPFMRLQIVLAGLAGCLALLAEIVKSEGDAVKLSQMTHENQCRIDSDWPDYLTGPQTGGCGGTHAHVLDLQGWQEGMPDWHSLMAVVLAFLAVVCFSVSLMVTHGVGGALRHNSNRQIQEGGGTAAATYRSRISRLWASEGWRRPSQDASTVNAAVGVEKSEEITIQAGAPGTLRWCFWQPGLGGSLFVIMQAVAWSMFAGAVLNLLLHIASFTQHAFALHHLHITQSEAFGDWSDYLPSLKVSGMTGMIAELLVAASLFCFQDGSSQRSASSPKMCGHPRTIIRRMVVPLEMQRTPPPNAEYSTADHSEDEDESLDLQLESNKAQTLCSTSGVTVSSSSAEGHKNTARLDNGKDGKVKDGMKSFERKQKSRGGFIGILRLARQVAGLSIFFNLQSTIWILWFLAILFSPAYPRAVTLLWVFWIITYLPTHTSNSATTGSRALPRGAMDITHPSSTSSEKPVWHGQILGRFLQDARRYFRFRVVKSNLSRYTTATAASSSALSPSASSSQRDADSSSGLDGSEGNDEGGGDGGNAVEMETSEKGGGEDPWDPSGRFIFGYHPHGIIPLVSVWCHWTPEWRTLFPGIFPATLIASIVHQVPIMRDVAQWMRCYEISKAGFRTALKHHGSVVMVPGGQLEMIHSTSHSKDTTLNTRHRGFIKLAMQVSSEATEGTPQYLVPIFSFGEEAVLDNLPTPHSLQRACMRHLRANALFFPYGAFNLPGIPRPTSLTLVVGEPILVPRFSNPSDEAVNLLHRHYYTSLKALFDTYKASSGHPDAELFFDPPIEPLSYTDWAAVQVNGNEKVERTAPGEGKHVVHEAMESKEPSAPNGDESCFNAKADKVSSGKPQNEFIVASKVSSGSRQLFTKELFVAAFSYSFIFLICSYRGDFLNVWKETFLELSIRA